LHAAADEDVAADDGEDKPAGWKRKTRSSRRKSSVEDNEN